MFYKTVKSEELKKQYCTKCPYKLGYIKSIKSPCFNCKVNGGKNNPPNLENLFKNEK